MASGGGSAGDPALAPRRGRPTRAAAAPAAKPAAPGPTPAPTSAVALEAAAVAAAAAALPRRPYPYVTSAPDARPPPRPLLPSAAAGAGPPVPSSSQQQPAAPAAGGAVDPAVSELLFIVARYLAGTPCQRAFAALQAELNEHQLLPSALLWTGEPRPLTYADLSARYPAVTPDYLPRLLDRLMQLASTYAVGVPAGLSSPLAGQALFGASGGTLTTSTTATAAVQPAHTGGRAAASLYDRVVRRAGLDAAPKPSRVPSHLYRMYQHYVSVTGHVSSVYCIDIDPTCSRFVTGSDDGLVKVWSLTTGYLIYTLRAHTNVITDVRISPDGKLVASASWDGTARIWSLETGSPVAVLRGHLGDPSAKRREVLIVAFAPRLTGDVNYLLTVGNDGQCLLWTYRLDTLVFELVPPVSFVLDMAKKDNVRSASFDNAGTRFAVVASDGVVRLFVVPPLTNAAVGYPASGLELTGHRGVVTSLAFSSSSERLVTGSYDGTVRLWRYDSVQGAWTSQALQAGFPQPAAEDAAAAAAPAPIKPLRVLVTVWTCDDAKVVVSVLGGALQVWDADTQQLLHTLRKHDHDVLGVAVHPRDSRILLSAGNDGRVIVWDIERGILLKELLADPAMCFVEGRISADGNYFVASCGDHRPYACAVFGLGSPGDDYARTPAEQFLARDYHAVVINPTTFGAVDAMTAMPPHALPRGPIYTSEHITAAYPAELQPTATTFSTTLTFPVGAWPHMVAEHAALHDLELHLVADEERINRRRERAGVADNNKRPPRRRRGEEFFGSDDDDDDDQPAPLPVFLPPQLSSGDEFVGSDGESNRASDDDDDEGDNDDDDDGDEDANDGSEGSEAAFGRRRSHRARRRTVVVSDVDDDDDEDEDDEDAYMDGSSDDGRPRRAARERHPGRGGNTDRRRSRPGSHRGTAAAGAARLTNGRGRPRGGSTRPGHRANQDGRRHHAPLVPHGPPGTWLAATRPWLAPYLPQIGDDVVYLHEGHRLFVQAHPVPPFTQTLPWVVVGQSLRTVEWCHIAGSTRFAEVVFVPGAPAYCRVTLQRQQLAPDAAGASGSPTPLQFSVAYYDSEGVSDFLILQSRFQSAMATQWEPEQAVWAQFGVGETLTWYAGTVLERRGGGADAGSSPWECYRVGWASDDPPSDLSPWELAEHSRAPPSSLVPAAQAMNAADKRRALRVVNRLIGQRWAHPFVDPVDVTVAPGYYLAVAYPICLTQIRDRLAADFYRRAEAFLWDIDVLAANAEAYNEPTSEIVAHARTLRDMAHQDMRDRRHEAAPGAASAMQPDAVKVEQEQEQEQEEGDDEPVDVEDPVTPVAARHATTGRAKRLKTHGNDDRVGHAAASDSDSTTGPSTAAAGASSSHQPHLRVRIRPSVPRSESAIAPVAESVLVSVAETETATAPVRGPDPEGEPERQPNATRTARSIPEPVSPQRATRARASSALPAAAPAAAAELALAGTKRRRG